MGINTLTIWFTVVHKATRTLCLNPAWYLKLRPQLARKGHVNICIFYLIPSPIRLASQMLCTSAPDAISLKQFSPLRTWPDSDRSVQGCWAAWQRLDDPYPAPTNHNLTTVVTCTKHQIIIEYTWQKQQAHSTIQSGFYNSN